MPVYFALRSEPQKLLTYDPWGHINVAKQCGYRLAFSGQTSVCSKANIRLFHHASLAVKVRGARLSPPSLRNAVPLLFALAFILALATSLWMARQLHRDRQAAQARGSALLMDDACFGMDGVREQLSAEDAEADMAAGYQGAVDGGEVGVFPPGQCGQDKASSLNIARREITPPCCRRHLNELLVYVAELFLRHNITLWADYGTLRSLVTNQGHLTPVEGDIEVGVLLADFPRILDLADDIARDGYFFFHESPHSARIFYSPLNAAHVAVYAHAEDERGDLGCVLEEPSARTMIPRADVLPTHYVKVDCGVAPIPADHVGFLRRRYVPVYGEAWAAADASEDNLRMEAEFRRKAHSPTAFFNSEDESQLRQLEALEECILVFLAGHGRCHGGNTPRREDYLYR
eukprot:jgi/Mesvir1/8397/Mv12641-RA.1